MLRDELVALLEPLESVRTPDGVADMLRAIGHGPALAGQAGLQAALAQVAGIVETLQAIDDASLESFDGIARILQTCASAFTATRAIDKAVTDRTLAPLAKDLGQQVVARIITLYLRARWPRLHRAASLLTIIDPFETAAPHPAVMNGTTIARMPWKDDALHLGRLSDLATRPWSTLREAYLPNRLATVADAHAAADRLFPVLGLLAESLGLRWFTDYRSLDPAPAPPSDGAIVIVDVSGGTDASPSKTAAPADAFDPTLWFSRRMPRLVMQLPGNNGSARIGISFVVSSAAHEGGVAGVVVTLTGGLSWSDTNGDWRIAATSSGDVPAFVLGPDGLALAPSTTPAAGANANVTVTPVATDAPALIIGSASGSRLELGAVRFGVDAILSTARRALGVTVAVDHAKLVVAPGDGDGFLRKVLPGDGVEIDCGVALALSSDRGFDIAVTLPNGVLSGEVPIGRSIGPVRVDALTRDFRPVTTDRGSGLAIELGVKLSAAIGPVAITLAGPGVGADVLWSLNDASATPNLGVLHVDGFGLRAPTGVGLAVDGALVVGAGSLLFDPTKHLYAGSLALVVKDKFALEVVGLLTTQMPDGGDGYSLLLLGLLRFPPIPIGFGFALNELGVLVGIHRTADVDALSGALASGDLAVLLFPANPAALATVPDALGKLFPPKTDAHVIGVMAGFTWGPSGLAQIELGVIYDTAAPARLVAIGRLTITRPQLVLQVLALGVLDLDQGELDLQARLFDSRVLGGDLAGDAALMVRWGRDPDLVLSIGGFHPAYHPPTRFTQRFRALQRLTFRAHTDASVLRLGLQAYLAVTSNTVQMGARVDFGVTVSALSIDGLVAFDALVQWDPAFYLDVAVQGSVALKIGGTTLLGARVAAQLIGPGDWYAHGTATISVLWWDLDCDFTVGRQPERPTQPPVDGVSQVVAALADPHSWGTQVASQGLVTVRRNAASGGTLVLHPLDALTVRQTVVPLQRAVDRIEAGPLATARTFDVTVTVAGNPATTTRSLTDAFARAKYQTLSEAAQLAAPAFDHLPSGVEVTFASASATAPAVNAGWTFESYLLTPRGLTALAPQSFVPDAPAVAHALATGAAAVAPLRTTGNARYAA